MSSENAVGRGKEMTTLTFPEALTENELFMPDNVSSLFQLYSFINPEAEIISFIIEHELLAVLLEAFWQIRRVFGNDIVLELELHHDHEEDFEGLFIIIKTNLSPEDSLNLLDRLDEEWWLYVDDDISNILEIMVRPR
ncbi:MAG: hypothetical protein AAGB97_01715 [Dehalococcoidia bacterium]|nr:hypothetical protein [Chloroflexota bacterium]